MSITKCSSSGDTGFFDVCDPAIITDTKNQLLLTSERLNELEKTVNTLRADFDKMVMWRRAVVEAVIGRAAITESSDQYCDLICPEITCTQRAEDSMEEDGHCRDAIYYHSGASNVAQKKGQSITSANFETMKNNDKKDVDDLCEKLSFG